MRSRALACTALISALALPPVAHAGGPPASNLPVAAAAGTWQPLAGFLDRPFQARLEKKLDARPAWRRLLREHKMAVGLVDLSRPVRPRFAAVNGNRMMYAASLPKIGILLSAFQSFEDGKLAETPEVLHDLSDMIRVSSNSAATRMIDRLGFRRIAAVLTSPRYRLYDERMGGGLWIGKRYASSGKRFPDPMRGISHAATVTQVCRFYYMLARGHVISPERSRQMLELLADSGLHHKFVGVLEQRAPQARLYRKSGTWRIWHADSVLVWGPSRHYILVGLVESPDGERILRDLVPVAEEVLRSAPEHLAAGF